MHYGWTFVHSMKGKIEHEERIISCHEKNPLRCFLIKVQIIYILF